MLLLAKLDDPKLWLLAAVALIAGILLVRSNRYYARQRQRRSNAARSAPLARRQQGLPPGGEAADGVEHLEVEMHDTARELSARLDSKIIALQSLVAEADRAAARLEAALAGVVDPLRQPDNQAHCLEHTGAASRDHAAASPTAPRAGRHEEVYALADHGYDAVEISRRVGSPIGEVELILSLRGKGDGGGGTAKG